MSYHLAQLNIGEMIAPMDSPLVADFVNNLDRINALADEAPGFIWRLQSEGGNAMEYRIFDENTLVNMSVWEDRDSLFAYVYQSAHVEFIRRRKEWFHHMKELFMVLWWIPEGHIPTIEEARDRLMHLREQGPTPHAFTFKKFFPAPERTTNYAKDSSSADS